MAVTVKRPLGIGQDRRISCTHQGLIYLNWPGKPCFRCQEEAEECELADEPRPGQNTEKPADIPDSSNRTAKATPIKAKATAVKATKATPVKQPTHGADFRFSHQILTHSNSPEATASRDLPEATKASDSEQDDLRILKEAKSVPLDQILREWAKSKDILATRPLTEHNMKKLVWSDAKAIKEIFSPACIRYMKHHLNTFVGHLKITGYDISKLNLDSPLGIPRVDPRFLPDTQNQHLPVDNSGHQQKKRKDQGGDDADDDNGGEGPSKRARV